MQTTDTPEIWTFAEREYPNEACGVLLLVGNKIQTVQCKNIAPLPKEHFILDPDDYELAADRGEVVAIWHSHPEASSHPSDADRYGCDDSGVPWVIVGIAKNSKGEFERYGVTAIEPNGDEPPLVGRPYIYGIYDCYTIVRDYYWRHFGIALGSYPQAPAGWWNSPEGDWFVQNYEKEGFIHAPKDDYQVGDLLFMQLNHDTANHAAIYVGDGMILHHCTGRLSKHDIYGGYWLKHTTHHLRHKNKC